MNQAEADTGAPDHRLDLHQFQNSLAATHRNFSLIRINNLDLKAYLVLSLPG